MNQHDQANLNQTKCQSNQVIRFLDGKMSDVEVDSFELHLAECSTCQQELESKTADQQAWSDAKFALVELSTDEVGGSKPVQPDDQLISRIVLRSLAPTDDPQMLGRLGSYEVSAVVGQGGMGVVLKAHDPALNRFVALKVLRPHLAISGSARQRFFREAKAAATIQHENVMPIHSVAEHNDLPYLVMPYIRGESLQQRISKNGPLTPLTIVRVAMQISSGLAAAHSQGLVHRDIKPANIILGDGVDKLWITDFGLARLTDDASLTRTGVIAGTPEYMSPEQARGNTIDARSDLFSLGAVMYSMCTGHPPFRATNVYGVMRRITDDEPRSIREINQEIPAWLESFVFKLLSKDVDHRFQSAEETSGLLKESLAHMQHPTKFELPPKVRKLSTSSKSKSNRNWKWIGAIAACLAASVVVAMSWPSLFAGKDKHSTFENKTAGSTQPDEPISEPDTNKLEPDSNLSAPQATVSDSRDMLPSDTAVWISIPNVKQFRANFDKTQMGTMVKQDSFKPFLLPAKVDLKNWLGKLEIPWGFDLLNKDWVTGEVGFAFVQNGGAFDEAPIRPIVFANVRGFEGKAAIEVLKILGEVDGAIQSKEDVHVRNLQGAGLITVWRTQYGTKQNPKRIFHTVNDGWLTVGDDVSLVVNAAKKKTPSLKENPSFQKVMSRTKFKNRDSDINWFINPHPAADLVNNLAAKKKHQQNDWLGVLQKVGFDVFSGAGGRIQFATGDHEMLQRTFVCHEIHAQNKPQKILKRKNVLGLFDFTNHQGDISPPDWVPANVASCLVGDWNKPRALVSTAPVYNAFIGDHDGFERLLNDFRVDPAMQLDIKKLIGSFGPRTMMMTPAHGRTSSQMPVLGFKIKADPKFVMDSLSRAVAGTEFKLLGYRGIETNVTEKDSPEKRIFVLANETLLVSNDKALIRQLLKKEQPGKLVESADYAKVHAALSTLTDPNKIGIREFGRLDLLLKPSYEQFRRGEYEFLRWFQDRSNEQENEVFGNRPVKPAKKRKPVFDGSKLPKDYDTMIGDFLGMFGWALETEDDGWMITGFLLKK